MLTTNLFTSGYFIQLHFRLQGYRLKSSWRHPEKWTTCPWMAKQITFNFPFQFILFVQLFTHIDFLVCVVTRHTRTLFHVAPSHIVSHSVQYMHVTLHMDKLILLHLFIILFNAPMYDNNNYMISTHLGILYHIMSYMYVCMVLLLFNTSCIHLLGFLTRLRSHAHTHIWHFIIIIKFFGQMNIEYGRYVIIILIYFILSLFLLLGIIITYNACEHFQTMSFHLNCTVLLYHVVNVTCYICIWNMEIGEIQMNV